MIVDTCKTRQLDYYSGNWLNYSLPLSLLVHLQIGVHNLYSKDALEKEDNSKLLNAPPSSQKSMEKQDLNQVNVAQPILTLKGYPLSNKLLCHSIVLP